MTRRFSAPAFAATTLAGIVAVTPAAWSAGYAVREQSAEAQGMAYAGISAGTGNISSIFYNPATLALHSGVNVTGEFAWIVPDVELMNAQATTIYDTSITGGSGGNLAHQAFVPAFYGSWQIAPDWHLGFSFNAPFGFTTSSEDPDWIGRYHALGSRLRTYNAEPMVAWQVSPGVAIGGGIQVQYTDARLTSAIDLGTVGTIEGAPGGVPGSPAQEGFAAIEGDDWSYGYSLGILLTPAPGTRIGVGYRSAMDIDLEGDANFALSAYGQLLSSLSGALVPTGGSASVTTPEMVTLGIKQDLDPQWTLAAELAWTRWSRFDQLVVDFDNPAQPSEVTLEEWEDSIFLALGLTYRPTDKLRLRTGVAFDEGVVPSADRRTPRIPDSDRYWLSFGAGYDLTESMTIDAAYTHIFSPDAHMNQQVADTGNAARGNLSGTFQSSADIVNASLSMKF
ncbi:outer membrane protein transport protein [Parvibaculum sp.]|uniref:OmpP1/FadL family transporter n=1 Tax=Parvibaculum sp. TaxID=2024848 RepID=UPI001B2B2A22|nr:outer membrane protein transport protein [Parvibaculum sp.]MBO6669530.1 outer membrane protein transport protein [Parvibaculum sp.]MBO6715916.1 outer membrane protein transport protein [Parvibaculum sp.]